MRVTSQKAYSTRCTKTKHHASMHVTWRGLKMSIDGREYEIRLSVDEINSLVDDLGDHANIEQAMTRIDSKYWDVQDKKNWADSPDGKKEARRKAREGRTA